MIIKILVIFVSSGINLETFHKHTKHFCKICDLLSWFNIDINTNIDIN